VPKSLARQNLPAEVASTEQLTAIWRAIDSSFQFTMLFTSNGYWAARSTTFMRRFPVKRQKQCRKKELPRATNASKVEPRERGLRILAGIIAKVYLYAEEPRQDVEAERQEIYHETN
jgi:hypothetical protein